MTFRYDCVACRKQVTATKNQRYRAHSNGDGDPCEMSSEQVPEHLLAQPVGEGDRPDVPREGVDFALCPGCGRNVKLTKLGYYEPHGQTLMGAERCEYGGVRANHHPKMVDVPDPMGVLSAGVSAATSEAVTSTLRAGAAAPVSVDVSIEEPGRSNLERQSMAEATGTSFPESPSTSSGSSSPELAASGPAGSFPYGASISERFRQPSSPYLQPPAYVGPERPEPMQGLAQDLATMIKETFYSYSNRRTADNRSAQKTLGPSEVGTPCDRRLAMELMNIPYVNPGGDGWAAWAGTQMHTGMAEIYSFADAGTGRYAIEFPVATPSPWVPRGTSDLFDRRINAVIDWKMMGAYSLKKFKLEGPSETYEVQGQVYGLGAELAGEKVKHVAIVGLPRAGSSLDEMHVHVMPYDRKRAEAALARVDRIAAKIGEIRRIDGLGETPSAMSTARTFGTADDCRYCMFFRKGDAGMEMGCPGV